MESYENENPYVSVVLPTYNEEEALPKVIDDVRASMQSVDYDYEILIVDDCSKDKTVEAAEKKDVRIVKRHTNGGSGSSRRTGIQNAKGEIIVMLDADGTYDASDIPKMVEFFPEFDQVNGARTSEKGTMRLLRTPAKWFIRKLACYLTGVNIPDLNTGLKAFKKDIMKKYLWVLPDGFSCVTTMTLAFLCNGYNVKYIPTQYFTRIGKSKFHPIKDTAAYLNVVVRMVMYFRPLRVFTPFAAFLFFGGILKSLFSFNASGSLQESDILIIMSAVLVMILGLIADLIVAHQKHAR